MMMNRYGYSDPFQTLVGNVPAYVGQQGPGGMMVPGGNGSVPTAAPPGPFGPYGPYPGNCFGPPLPPIMPQAAVAAVQRCAQPFGLTSDNGDDPIAVGETRAVTSSPQAWMCVKDIDIPRTVSPFFLITSIKFGTCELLQNGPIHADTLSSDAIHPCLSTYAVCPGQSVKMSVKNLNTELALHFYATMYGESTQNCLPCDYWG